MTAAEMLAKLKNMAKQGGERAYERIALAAKLLENRDWLAAEPFKGDEGLARDQLEKDYFGDLCGVLALHQLLEIHQHFPNLEQWAAVKFNLKALWGQVEELRAAARKEKAADRAERKNPVPHKVHEEALEAKKIVEQQFKHEQETHRADVESRDGEIQRLRSEVSELRIQNAELNGRVKQLERLHGNRRELAGVA